MPLKKLQVVIIMMFALFGWSCQSSKTVVEKEQHESHVQTDSVSILMEKTTKAVTTPQAKAKVTVSPEQLISLPVGAQYQSKDKNATGTIRKTEDNKIEFTANCDSLIILVQELKTEVHHLNSQNTALKTQLNEQKTVEVNKLTGLQWFQIYGFRLYLLLTIIYIIYRKWKRK